MLFEEEDIKGRSKEYITELYGNPYGVPTFELRRTLDWTYTILKSDFRHAVVSMKNGKAVGPGKISTEVIKALDEVGIDVLHEILNEMYNTGIIPRKMSKSIFVAFPKTSGAIECGSL